MHNRQNALNKWLEQVLDLTQFSLKPLPGDASFRHYCRLYHSGISQIVMDAPPEKEPLYPFVTILKILSNNQIHTPQLYAVDESQGFALLEDFGDNLLLDTLIHSQQLSHQPNIIKQDKKVSTEYLTETEHTDNKAKNSIAKNIHAKTSTKTVDALYILAINTLIKLQQIELKEVRLQHSYLFPCFDKQFILNELSLFNQWFLKAYLAINLTNKEEILLQQTFEWLADEISKQPQVIIHRDYHSRNIMLITHNDKRTTQLGIIDFQDAMQGPFAYDLVSLLKDCYIQWPHEQMIHWLTLFYEQSNHAKQWSLPLFIRAFDLCGLQRHLKVLGIFSRLYLRDNKPNYLKYLPLTFHYVLTCLESYDELQNFYHFAQKKIQLP